MSGFIFGSKRPTQEQAKLMSQYIREISPDYVHFIKTNEMFQYEPGSYLSELESHNPRPLDVQKFINENWVKK